MRDSGYNPDVLTCLANLSSDEVFTPPALANQMLDSLPAELWSDKNARFLDPACKSGVFLREIAKRLDVGLTDIMPERQSRLNHIFSKQLFGIAITELTAMMSRRSLYCSRLANGKYSVCTVFSSDAGNIRYTDVQHKWSGGRCEHCGARAEDYDRDIGLEAHAYEFIHTPDPNGIFDMKFDVIIGNPPYQLSDGGHGRSASPIYQLFVEQAKRLRPRYLTMIIPARWFGGGKGLAEFRATMLTDARIRKLVDYENVKDVFPGVDLAGGVCYFLWDRDSPGPCEVTNINGDTAVVETRNLNEFPTFVRHSGAVPVIRKVLAEPERRMSAQVTSRKPFGLATNVRPAASGELTLRWEKGEGPFPRSGVTVGSELIDKWKVITSYVGYDHAGNPGRDGRRRVLSKIDILPPGFICTETYLVVGAYDSKKEAVNLVSYMKTKFFRFLMAQFMYSHHLTRSAYEFVPVLDMTKEWDDAALARRYGLTRTESAFIDSKIRPYDNASDANG